MAQVRRLRASDGRVSWTVVDDRGIPIPEVDDFLAYLSAIERSPNSQRAYAFDLKLFFDYLADRQLGFADVTGEDLGYFVQYLRRPAPEVPVIGEAAAVRTATTVNRIMAGVGGFYRFLGDRDDLPAATRLARQARFARRTGLLDGIARARPGSSVIGHEGARARFEIPTISQARSIIDACGSFRDRFFFSLLFTTGMRRGQALGLRHADIDTRAKSLTIAMRADNENGARPKSRKPVTVPLSRDVCLALPELHAR